MNYFIYTLHQIKKSEYNKDLIKFAGLWTKLLAAKKKKRTRPKFIQYGHHVSTVKYNALSEKF